MTNEEIGIDIHSAQDFLAHKLASPPTDVALIGEGAWSRCFGFCHDNEQLAIRFGKYVEDFEKDRRAYQYAGPNLPIPEVRDIGTHGDLHYAISTRVHGAPLESVSSDQWRAVVPSLVAALEAMRTADISSTSGIGGWGNDGNAHWATWSQCLLSVDVDRPEQRGYGWRKRLSDEAPEEDAAFTWGYNLLRKAATNSAPRSLLHRDLINRNVLVEGRQISGIFDWGCSIYGDHLYELAWFEFWAPWSPQLNIPYLRAELERQWRTVGYTPTDMEARLMACYLHIGLEHLAYNAYLRDWPALSATAQRMRALVAEMQ